MLLFGNYSITNSRIADFLCFVNWCFAITQKENDFYRTIYRIFYAVQSTTYNFQRKYGVVHDLLSVFAMKRLYFQSAPGSLLLITKIKDSNKKTPLAIFWFSFL